MSNRPQVFKNKATEPTTVERIDYHWPLSAEEFRKTFPDGRMLSAPWLATEAHGQQIIDVTVKALVSALSSMLVP